MEKITLTNGQEIPANSILFNVAVPIDDGIQIKTPISLVQYDSSMAVICFRILENNKQYIPPSGASLNVRMRKPDKHEVYNPVAGQDSDGNVYVLVTSQMTASFGVGDCSIEIKIDGKQKNTKSVPVYISENPVSEKNIESTDEYQSVAEIVAEIKELSEIITENKEVIDGIYENITEIQNVSNNMSSVKTTSSNINNINIVAQNTDAISTVLENIDDIKNAPTYASDAKQSAQQAEQQANNASQSAMNASKSESSAKEQATKAEQQATSASQSASSALESANNAQNSLTQATQKANEAAQSATSAAESENNAKSSAQSAASDKEQAAQSAQNAASSASSASADATRAEEAAEKAEQISGFNPSKFATAEQGKKADTALQPGALDNYATKSEIPEKLPNPQTLTIQVGDSVATDNYDGSSPVTVKISTETIGAATTEQGRKADTALQPNALDSYATKEEIPQKLPNPQQLSIKLGDAGSTFTYDGSSEQSITVNPSSIGAATTEQGTKADTAVQPNDLTSYAKKTDIPNELPNPQQLGIKLGRYGSTTYYDGSSSKTVTITPESIGAQPAGTSSGTTIALLWINSNPTSMDYGDNIYVSGLSGYDLIGIVPIANLKYGAGRDCCGMQIFKVSEATAILSGVSYRGAGPEVQSREIYIKPNSNTVMMGDASRFNNTESVADSRACIPYFIYGIKF